MSDVTVEWIIELFQTNRTKTQIQLDIYRKLYNDLDHEARRLTDQRHRVMKQRAYYKVEIERTLDALAQENA